MTKMEEFLASIGPDSGWQLSEDRQKLISFLPPLKPGHPPRRAEAWFKDEPAPDSPHPFPKLYITFKACRSSDTSNSGKNRL